LIALDRFVEDKEIPIAASPPCFIGFGPLAASHPSSGTQAYSAPHPSALYIRAREAIHRFTPFSTLRRFQPPAPDVASPRIPNSQKSLVS
jgi:hypothetical protein